MKGACTAVTAMLLAIAAGNGSAAATDAGEAAQRIVPVFDCYRTNSAWGFTLSGKVIDAEGGIFGYGSRGKAWLATPAKESDATFYSESELADKFNGALRSGSVDPAALADNMRLIEAAGAGKLSTADGGARDAGYSGCHAYMRDAARQRYRDVDLGSDGGVSDSRMTNDSDAARQLLGWLRSIGVAQ